MNVITSLQTPLPITPPSGPLNLAQPGVGQQPFKSFMMESLGQQLNGQVQLSYAPTGFVYALDVPLGSLIAAA